MGIVRAYSRPCRCQRWRGILPSLGVLAFIAMAAITGYEVGRYHRSVGDFAEAVRNRLVYVQPEWRTAEPDHTGKAGGNR